jgi:putative ABC transport system permease protein
VNAATSRLPFPLLFWLRSRLGRDRLLSLLTVAAIATSVALATGLEMSSRGVEAELQRTADVLAGSAELEIAAGSLGIPESLLERVAATGGVRAAAPMIEDTMRLAGGPRAGMAIHVLGIDLLADPSVRAYRFDRTELEVRDPLRLIAGADSLVITTTLAERLGVGPGDEIALESEHGPLTLTVRGTLEPSGIAEAFGGQLALMDVYAMQQAVARQGWLDRIDIVVDPDGDVDTVARALQAQVQGVATVRRAAQRDAWVDNTVSAIGFVIWALVVVGALVASLLSFATISLSVERRLGEFALLRAAGLEGRRVRNLLRVEAAGFTVIATALGLGLGVALSRGFVPILSNVSAYLQDVEIQRVEPSFTTFAVGIVVGVLVGVLGSLGPTRRGAALPPLEVLAAHRHSRPPRRSTARVAAVHAPIALAWIGLSLGSFGMSPIARLGLIFALGILWIAVATRDFFPALLLRIRPWLELGVRSVGRLAGASLLARPVHSAVTVATVAGVVAGVTVSLVLVQSLSDTLDDWTAGQYPGAIYVVAENLLGGRDRDEILPEVVEEIRLTPGVRAVFEHYTATILFRGEEALLGASSMAVMAEQGRLPVIGGDEKKLALALAAGDIAISDQFAGHFGVEVGDTISLDTPRGRREFRVAGMIRDYAGPAGSLNLDLAVFDGLWDRNGSSNLVIWVDGAVEPTLDEIRRRVRDRQTIYFVYGEALERYASSVIGQFTRLLDVVAGMTALLGGLAVMNLLLGAVVDRRRELALLRAAGATNRQLMALVLLDGLIVSAAGSLAGIALGVACAYPMVTEVVRTAFSWWILFTVDPDQLLALGLALIAASLAASAYPAWLTRRVSPREVLAPE